MTALPIAAALLFVCLTPALAQTDCANARDQRTMDDCAAAAYKASDAALNDVYKKLSASVSDDGRKQLQAAQRAWIAYRDAQCSFETLGTAGASINPMVYSLCLDAVTQAQTARLTAQANCEEGDLSCGGQ